MADERNFRSYYFEKVGIRGVEEKKSVEILLKEQPLDTIKLSQFCLRFPCPAVYRPFVWKVLLGILPPQQTIHSFVSQQRTEQYQDLKHALEVMSKIDEKTPLPDVFLKMYHVQEGTLMFEEDKMMKDPMNQTFLAMAEAFTDIFEDDVDMYWMSIKFYQLQNKHKHLTNLLVERMETYLKKEDVDNKLFVHLVHLNAFNVVPFPKWFNSCFAGVLPETALERVWDKLIGGSCKILIFVAVAILLTLRRPLLSMNGATVIADYLSKISPDSADLIVTKAIEMWQKYGSLLMPVVAKSDSPIIIEKAAL